MYPSKWVVASGSLVTVPCPHLLLLASSLTWPASQAKPSGGSAGFPISQGWTMPPGVRPTSTHALLPLLLPLLQPPDSISTSAGPWQSEEASVSANQMLSHPSSPPVSRNAENETQPGNRPPGPL